MFHLQVLIEINHVDCKVPHFPVDSVRLSVREDVPVETVIYVASAVSLDHSSSPSVVESSSAAISYTLLGSSDPDNDANQYFDVDRITGRIKLRRRLDRETKSIHRFSVLAAAAACRLTFFDGRLDVEVIVTDANDNNPKFDRQFYVCRLPPPPTPAANTMSSLDDDIERPHQRCTIQASDNDEGLAARLSYHFDVNVDDSDDDRGSFDIDSETGEIRWAAAAAFDVIRCPPEGYRLRVAATDGGFPTQRSTSVGIFVVMTTEDGPCRARLTGDGDGILRLAVEENSPSYSRIGSAAVVTESGRLMSGKYFGMRYSLDFRVKTLASDDVDDQENAVLVGDRFGIDSETGEVFTKIVLDREQRSRYEFQIVAVIGQNSQAKGSRISRLVEFVCWQL